jgi:hypothetical protein
MIISEAWGKVNPWQGGESGKKKGWPGFRRAHPEPCIALMRANLRGRSCTRFLLTHKSGKFHVSLNFELLTLNFFKQRNLYLFWPRRRLPGLYLDPERPLSKNMGQPAGNCPEAAGGDDVYKESPRPLRALQ